MNQKLVLSGQDKSFKMNTHNVPIWHHYTTARAVKKKLIFLSLCVPLSLCNTLLPSVYYLHSVGKSPVKTLVH